jgi:acyl-CoA reductase-like NAD-dependent aldehyde dehydrogenase
MKNYKILYAYYPFKKETVKPLVEMVEANTLEDAFSKMNDMYGHSIEVFKEPARKFYKE